MSDEAIMRLILQKLADGQLPSALPRATWGGVSATNGKCSACDQLIRQGQMEIEADCVDGLMRRYHSACHQILESVRR